MPSALFASGAPAPERDWSGCLDAVIASNLAQICPIQEDIERLLKLHHFSEQEIFGINLALGEALVNAIQHGNQMDPNKKVRISYWVSSERFDVGIADEGNGFDPGDVLDPLAPENLGHPSGRGLLLMRHYMTEVLFQPPGNAVSMSKVRHTGRPAHEEAL